MASILLSPCHLASIPLIIGYIAGEERHSAGGAAKTALAFAVGILATVALIGVALALLGRTMGGFGTILNYAVAVVFFVVGLELLGILELRWWTPRVQTLRRRGLRGALMLGLVFGLALGPCTFAFLAPVIGASFAVGATNTLLAVALLSAFGLGHCAVIVVAGSSIGFVQSLLDWDRRSHGLGVLRKASGVLVLAGGIYLVYVA